MASDRSWPISRPSSRKQIDALESQIDPVAETLETVLMRPRKSDITVDSLGLVWMPYWQDEQARLMGAWG